MSTPLPTDLFDRRQLITDAAELITYEVDAGFDYARPDGAFFPESADDISRMVRWAQANKVPLVARGAGTGLAGGAVAAQGGIVTVFSRMNRIIDVDELSRTALVQPGAVNLTVDARVKEVGLYYPPDPASGRSSVIGGNVGTNAGGPHCFKYGVTTNYVCGLNVVLSDGEHVRLGGVVADYPEYDLTALVVGSEGTLCVVTDATLRLIRNPPAVKTMMVSFASEQDAGKAVSAVIAAGLVPATLELMDQRSMRMIEEFAHAGLPVEAGAALIVEVDGYAESLDTQMEEVADLLHEHGASDLRLARSEEERQQIWYGRKSAAGAFSRLAPSYYLTDITVRRSLLGEVLTDINAVCDHYNVRTANFYHAGDGNLHPLILCDQRDKELMDRVHQASDEIIRICLERDGSISGEHGIGMEKRAYMAQMYSPAELSAMHDVKRVFDPHTIFNPGKVLPAELPILDPIVAALPAANPFVPASAQEASAALAAFSAAKRSVRLGAAPQGDRQGADVWLSSSKLREIHHLAPEDLYVTVGAGLSLADLQTTLAEEGLQVPLRAPWPEMTMGGLVATNQNGPLRMRYGNLRDVLLSATVVLGDGRMIRAGRPLVKNAAGYDLPKVFVGSYGTLGLLVDVTCKLTSLPRARRTLAVPITSRAHGMVLAAQALPHALAASGLILVEGAELPGVKRTPGLLLYSAEGLNEDVDAEIKAVGDVLRRAGAGTVIETGIDANRAWSDFFASMGDDHLVVRLGAPVKALAGLIDGLPPGPGALPLCVDFASGLIYLAATPGNGQEAQQWLDDLRRAVEPLDGYALAIRAPSALRGRIDPWGYRPPALDVMSRLRSAWDPAGILNPGAFTVG